METRIQLSPLTHFEVFVEEALVAKVGELEVVYPLRSPPPVALFLRDASHHLNSRDTQQCAAAVKYCTGETNLLHIGYVFVRTIHTLQCS